MPAGRNRKTGEKWHGMAVNPADVKGMELFGWTFICFDNEGYALMYAVC